MRLQGELDDEGGQAPRVLLDREGDASLAAAEEGAGDEIAPPRIGAREGGGDGGAGNGGGGTDGDLALGGEDGEGAADGAEDADDAGGAAAAVAMRGGGDEGKLGRRAEVVVHRLLWVLILISNASLTRMRWHCGGEGSRCGGHGGGEADKVGLRHRPVREGKGPDKVVNGMVKNARCLSRSLPIMSFYFYAGYV